MGQFEDVFRQAIQQEAKKGLVKTIGWGTASKVTDTTCTVDREDAPILYGVLLNAIDYDLQSFVTIYPAEGSSVLVGIVENLKTEAVVLKCSEVEKVKLKIGEQTLLIDKNGFVFNEGQNKGLVKIQEMVDWMAKVYGDLQTLKTLLLSHPVAGNGSPLALTFNPTTSSPAVSTFENQKIKQ